MKNAISERTSRLSFRIIKCKYNKINENAT
nr:MAG TPA: hypothetical protein [Caudoviricetes sp.]